MTEPPRVLFVTDSDSYVKWGAALANQVPKDWPVRLVVARGNAEPSPRQLSEALEGTRFEGEIVERVGMGELHTILNDWGPDVVVAAARGLAVHAMVTLIPNRPDRPVLVSGLAGIAVPVIPFGLGFRRAVDVFVLHSRRELREFALASKQVGIPHTYRLATVPFISTAPQPIEDDAMRLSAAPAPVRNRIVFAAQAMVPASRRDRVWLLRRLVETARAHPQLDVVIKVRARDGEPQTHVEHFSYELLLDDMIAAGEYVPSNVVVESGAMKRHLKRAVGLVTVSSTAILEAIAEDIPCLALTDFGVGAEQINSVLLGSGLLGTSDDLVEAEFRHPNPEWLDDNYFHEPAQNTWLPQVESLLERRRISGLPAYAEVPKTWMNRMRAMFYRHLAFAPEPGSRRDLAERVILAAALWANRRRWAVVHAIRHLRF
ncbi:MAG: DUF6716 putative glycosyltransferase [Aeromicrobium sp.]